MTHRTKPCTDLIDEARELLQPDGDPGALPGVRSRETPCGAFRLTEVEVLDAEGAEALGKPIGRYRTLQAKEPFQHRAQSLREGAEAVAAQVRALLGEACGSVLVVGLGNRAVTPDAVGPRMAERLLVTRHLVSALPDTFGSFRPVAAIAPGVLFATGVESGEIARCVAEAIRPSAVIAVDALCAQSPARLGSTIQFSDTGISPGSGVGNRRFALNRETLGVPVLAVGVPTVVRADTLAGTDTGKQTELAGLLVTPKDIDLLVEEAARILGFGISLALQPGLRFEELEELLR